MEQIVVRDGRWLYGDRVCDGPDGAYRLFRDEWNASVGRVAFRRLNRLGSRRERVHGHGFVFSGEWDRPEVRCVVTARLLGLVCGSYCRIAGCGCVPDGLDDESVYRWLDAVFECGSGLLRTVYERRKPTIKGYGRKEKQTGEALL